jgi:hypothetical protein
MKLSFLPCLLVSLIRYRFVDIFQSQFFIHLADWNRNKLSDSQGIGNNKYLIDCCFDRISTNSFKKIVEYFSDSTFLRFNCFATSVIVENGIVDSNFKRFQLVNVYLFRSKRNYSTYRKILGSKSMSYSN